MNKVFSPVNKVKSNQIGSYIAKCASLAALLEVSAYPKPGNIHRTQNFSNTRYEHFLAGSISWFPIFSALANKAYLISNNSKSYETLGIGKYIYSAVTKMLKWQSGGNVHLGIILLLSPLTAAAGSVLRNKTVDFIELRTNLKDIIHKSKPQDSVKIYDAISIAMSDENLGKVEELDITDKSSVNRLIENRVTPIDVFKKCSERDMICNEWVTNFHFTFNESYPYLKKRIQKNQDINNAIVDTFLYILSQKPDSLIQRKLGLQTASDISVKAQIVIEKGGMSTSEGKRLSWAFDRELQQKKGKLNPGTTADLTAAAIFLLLLEGWRP